MASKQVSKDKGASLTESEREPQVELTVSQLARGGSFSLAALDALGLLLLLYSRYLPAFGSIILSGNQFISTPKSHPFEQNKQISICL